jgi:hypothetical protein
MATAANASRSGNCDQGIATATLRATALLAFTLIMLVNVAMAQPTQPVASEQKFKPGWLLSTKEIQRHCKNLLERTEQIKRSRR